MRYRMRSVLLLLALSAAPVGCNVIGVITDKVAGDLPVEPAHKPDPLRPLLVIAENYRDPTNVVDAERIQEIVTDRLRANEVAPIVSSERLIQMRDRSPSVFGKMSVVEIARAVGAEQVVYIDLGRVGVGTQVGGDSLKGVASANVKLIDATTGAVLYPKDIDAGVTISFESDIHQGSADMTPDRIRGETLMGLGVRIARLFHTYRRSDLERINTYE